MATFHSKSLPFNTLFALLFMNYTAQNIRPMSLDCHTFYITEMLYVQRKITACLHAETVQYLPKQVSCAKVAL